MDKNELLELKEKIEQAKSKLSELKGRKITLIEALEKECECKTVKQAKRKLDIMKQEIEELETKKDKGIKELEEKYEF